MNWFKLHAVSFRFSSVATILALCSACASKPVVDTNVTIHFPSAERVTSVDQANQMLDDVALARQQIDWRYRQKEQICYDKFFMNKCLQEAKDERRVDLARVKQSEVAANYFKRRDQVEEMDRNLVEKNVASPLPDPNAVKKPAPDSDDAEMVSDPNAK